MQCVVQLGEAIAQHKYAGVWSADRKSRTPTVLYSPNAARNDDGKQTYKQAKALTSKYTSKQESDLWELVVNSDFCLEPSGHYIHNFAHAHV